MAIAYEEEKIWEVRINSETVSIWVTWCEMTLNKVYHF